MTSGPDVPDRWFVALGGRTSSHHTFDPVSLIITERVDGARLGLEQNAILRLCRSPTAVVEIAGVLRLPLGVVTVLLSDLLDTGHITVRHPRTAPAPSGAGGSGYLGWQPLSAAMYERVLVGLRRL